MDMKMECIKSLIKKQMPKFKYAWIHSFDCLDILDISRIDLSESTQIDLEKSLKLNLNNLIELKLFSDGKEWTLTRKHIDIYEKSKEDSVDNLDDIIGRTWEMSEADIINNENIIRDQQVISLNKIVNLKYNKLDQKKGRYIIEILNELDYEMDGQAYIKNSHLVNIKYKSFEKEMEE